MLLFYVWPCVCCLPALNRSVEMICVTKRADTIPTSLISISRPLLQYMHQSVSPPFRLSGSVHKGIYAACRILRPKSQTVFLLPWPWNFWGKPVCGKTYRQGMWPRHWNMKTKLSWFRIPLIKGDHIAWLAPPVIRFGYIALLPQWGGEGGFFTLFCTFFACLDSNQESCRSKQAGYQLKHPSSAKLSHPYPSLSHPSPSNFLLARGETTTLAFAERAVYRVPGCICSCRIMESPWLRSLRMQQHAFYRYQEEARADSYRSIHTQGLKTVHWAAANNNLPYLT